MGVEICTSHFQKITKSLSFFPLPKSFNHGILLLLAILMRENRRIFWSLGSNGKVSERSRALGCRTDRTMRFRAVVSCFYFKELLHVICRDVLFAMYIFNGNLCYLCTVTKKNPRAYEAYASRTGNAAGCGCGARKVGCFKKVQQKHL